MDSNWKDDLTLGLTAKNLGEKVIEMYHSCGIPIPTTYLDPKGPPVGDVQQKVIEMFIFDAEDFMSLDPQKIIDEYQRMQRAADATGGDDSEPRAHLSTAHTRLVANWHGDAALAFGEQMIRIQLFMDQQQERLVYALQAMGTAFGLAVEFRQGYYDLAKNTIEACRAVISKRPDEPTVSSTMIAIGSQLVKLGTGAIGSKNPKDLMKVGVDWFKEQFENANKESAPIDHNDPGQVLGSYLYARDRLRGSFEDGLNQLRAWLDDQRSTYFSLKVPMLEPLPACTDVASPDFSYGRFFSNHHDPSTYTPKVERERKKFVDEYPRQEGPIHRRLKGEE